MAVFDPEELQEVLDDFGDGLISAARRNLRSKKKNASGRLSKTMKHESNVSPNSFEFRLKMESYAMFQDAGVKGTGGVRKYKNGVKLKTPTRWKLKKVDTKYFTFRFRKGKQKVPSGPIDRWLVRKGGAPRGSGGRFVKRRSQVFGISTAIHKQGIAASNFFTDPYERLFKKFVKQDVLKAFALDAESFLQSTLEENLN